MTALSFLFHNALKGMLMLSGKIHHESHFSFRNFIGKNTTFTNAILMNVQHDPRRVTQILVKELLKNVNDEFHRREIIV